jgi:hypothetical protein
MDSISATRAAPTVTADAGSVQAAAQVSVMKKATHLQAEAVATLLQSMPQPQLATSGSLGTQVNTYA